MSNEAHRIARIEQNSPAANGKMKLGENLIAINGHELEDIFDYHYYSDDDILEIDTVDDNGLTHNYHIEKEIGQDLGIQFENGLMDDYKSCHNKCIFCFIDQMPPGMRDTLYFKDDDTRLSFLQGNYVTLTNIKQKDLNRIIHYHLAPINISVHTTNPTLRCEMLHNRFAGDILDKIEQLSQAEIEMNSQIVLCPGINDGKELERTIEDLLQFYPNMQSLSVVPVGLTKYRDGLYPLECFTSETAKEVISIIEKWQNIAVEKTGAHFVQASDEWYLLAGYDMPEESRYDGYIQLENGVGMLRLLWEEFHEELQHHGKKFFAKKKKISIATGKLAAPYIQKLCDEFTKKYPKTEIVVHPITNDFFGPEITVSGLITGSDLMEQLKRQDLGDKLLLPCNMLRIGEEVFLDDVTLEEVKTALQVSVDIVKSSGQDFVTKLLN